MKKKDWVRRICRHLGGERDWLLIERRQCTNENCNKTHRLLPADLSLPYKHYETDAIEGVIDGIVTEDMMPEKSYPCRTTFQRWRRWAEELLRNAEGQLRSVVHRVYDLGYEFLKSEESLLEELKKRIGNGWLTAVVRINIDMGGG